MSPINAVLGAATRPAHAAADLLGSAWRIVSRVDDALERIEVLIGDIEATNAHAQAVTGRVDVTARQAAASVDQLSVELHRAVGSLTEHREALEAGGRTLDHAGRVLTVEHVDSAVRLLELMPDLIDLVIPALRGMAGVSSELDQLADRFDSVGQIVEGLPGAKRLRQRGEDREQDLDQDRDRDRNGNRDAWPAGAGDGSAGTRAEPPPGHPRAG